LRSRYSAAIVIAFFAVPALAQTPAGTTPMRVAGTVD
jgi:hypothetical protein